jgi:carboxypeptidase family protein
MLTKKALLLVFCSLVFPICPLLYGQATASFFGTVTDKTGSVVTGASVKATAQGTGVARESRTDDIGHYNMPLLPIGDYTIRVEAQGFGPAEQKDVRLQVDEHRELNFTLSPASVTQAVEVTATEVAVQSSNPTLGQVITSEQVAQLPLNGRDFVQLATLIPGTTQETNPNSFFTGGPSSEVSTRGTYSLSVGGSRAQSTDWLLDGNDNNELTGGGISILPSIDAIQEFKVLTYNYSAEYGTRAGPTVLVTTKSGSNGIHGSLFEFFRNTKLDARSYFAPSREQFNLNQFGGALGGPIQKDKTFFFLDYQARRQRHGTPFAGVVPTQAMVNGDFSADAFGAPRVGFLKNPYASGADKHFQCDGAGNPIPADATGNQAAGVDCNKIPANVFDPVGAQMLKLYPVSNAANAALGFNYTNVPVRSIDEGEFDVRLDRNFSSKDSAFARFSYDQATNFIPGGSPGFAAPSPFASSQNITNRGRNVAISETHIFSDRTINQFSAGFNRIFNHILSFGDKSCESAKLGILGANINSTCPNAPAGVITQSTKDCVSCGLTTTLNVGGYWSLGDRGFAPFQGGTNVFSISDSLDMIRGKHDIRVGLGVRANQMNVETNAFQDGFFVIAPAFTGDGAGDLLLGLPVATKHDQTFAGATTGRRWKMYRPYVQDDWRVTNNLTVNLGLAWALTTPVKESANRQANFDFATGKLLIAGSGLGVTCAICVQSDGAVGIKIDRTAVEPRIGLAWKPFGSQNTAIRAGYAIFHDSSWNQGAQGLWQNPPFFAEAARGFQFCPLGNTTLNCGLSRSFLPPIVSPPDPTTFPGTLQSQNVDFKLGRVQQFNVNVERQVFGNLVLTAGYAGSRSSHILVDGLNLNIGSPTACGVVSGYTLGCGAGGAAFAAPYPTFGIISNINDVGQAKYDSLQIKAETRSVKHGLYALLGYTYAKTYDSGLNDGLGSTVGAPYWPLPGSNKLDWGLSQLNVNHTFTASVTYDLPFGKGKRFGSNWSGAVDTILGNWEVDVIQRVLSGFPVFIVNSTSESGVNFQQNASTNNRPNQTCSAEASNRTLSQWFNTSCFSAAPVGELGNASRAPVSGPDFVNTDFSVIKHFKLPYRDGMQVDFRSEFFNVFNHAQFGPPNSDISAAFGTPNSALFGKINSTVNNPRVIQFALKLRF